MAEFRKGPKCGQVPMKPLKGAIVWIIVGAIILLLLSILAGYSVYWRHTGKFPGLGVTAEKPEEIAPLHVKKSLDVTTWWGPDIMLDTNETVDWAWTVDAWGLVRYNHDDSLIQKLPPMNCPDKVVVVNHGAITKVQFSIKPGGPIPYGSISIYKRMDWEKPAFR